MNESNSLKIINNSIASGKVFHSYVFVNENNFSENARYLTKKILDTTSQIESHPSVIYIDPGDKMIRKEDVISAANRLKTTSTHEGARVLFIKGIDKGNKSSLNSLLKLIEEPHKDVYIIMTASNIDRVIRTIVSRSQVLFDTIGKTSLTPTKLLEMGMPENWIPFYSTLNMSSSDIMGYYDSPFHTDLEDTLDILSKSLDNKAYITGPLAKLINKDNYKMILFAMDTFYSDIWKLQEGVEIVFTKHVSTINSYAAAGFHYEIPLRIIRDFLAIAKYNVNFNLAKTNLLIELEESYG